MIVWLKRIGIAVAAGIVLILAIMWMFSGGSDDARIGSLTTKFNFTSPSSSVGIDRIDDPVVSNVSCYMSRGESGGWWSWIGMSDDPTKFSIACRATNETTSDVCITQPFPQGEKLASKSANALFKTVDIHRFLDKEKAMVLYVVISREVIGGADDNSITAVSYKPGCSKT